MIKDLSLEKKYAAKAREEIEHVRYESKIKLFILGAFMLFVMLVSVHAAYITGRTEAHRKAVIQLEESMTVDTVTR